MKIDYKFEDKDLTPEFIVRKMRQWREDPFLWMTEQVYTIDESDIDNPVKPFPPYRYLKEIINCYFRNKIIVVCKSRRMMATHLFSALALHQFLFIPYSENIIVSINEERAKKVIQTRCKKMFEFLDKRFPYPVLKEKEHLLVSQMINPIIGSSLTALPSGSDKCRGLTVTNAFYDEFAFQNNCEENLKAVRPALEGPNCRGAIVSTPKFGTKFQELVSKIKSDSYLKEIMEGITEIKNEYNQTVLSVHYKADPAKRTDEWYYKERHGSTPQGDPIPGASGVDSFTWDQEYELSFTVPTGKPVVPEFDKTLHCGVYEKEGEFIDGEPLEIGIDFGSHYPSAVFCQRDSLNRCIIHNALLAQDEELENFLVRVRDFIAQQYPTCEDNFRLYADPAGSYYNSHGTAAPAVKIVQQFFKKQVQFKKSRPIDRARAIRNKFSKKVGDTMGVIVNPAAGIHIQPTGEQRNGVLVEGFETGWIYNMPRENEVYKDAEPKKDGYYEHMMDALGYMFIHVFPTMYERAYSQRTGGAPPKKKSRRRYI